VPDEEIREQLHNLMGQMLFEFDMQNLPIEERVDFSVLGPTLSYELRNAGIYLPFEFAVLDAKGKANTKLSSKAFKSADKSHVFKTTLFPSEIVPHPDQLAIFFPDRLSYIYGSVIWLLLGSVLFTVIILITFFYTLRIMVNQKRVSEVKTDFINNMTHEFKTPIATIQLAADSIVNPSIVNQPEKVQRFIHIIKEENRRMHRHVESVLQMSLLDKKDFNLNLQPVHVHPLIQQAVNNISLQVEQKGGKISLEMQSANDYVKVDQTHFINVIYNLLDNANKYSIDREPEISVTTSSVDGMFYVSVSDKGIGMDRETQDKVFEKFYRHPMGDVHTVKGFGLGLSYAKAIILSCKGEIKINSKKGAGSTFTIQLPLLPNSNE
jgi:two-component system phosphate regulon sensor histidine kinase PhoR